MTIDFGIPELSTDFASSFIHRLLKLLVLFPALLVVVANSARSQDVPIIRTHTFEAGGFVGASYGIDKTRVMGGGNLVYSLTRTIMPYAEFSYFPGIGRTTKISGLENATTTYSIPLTDFNFGLHVRFPIPKSRVIPYAVIGAGGIHSPEHTFTTRYPNPIDPSQIVEQEQSVPSSTDFAINFGAGLRLYATERLGFRGEFKAYKPTGTPAGASQSDFFYRVAGGFFFQF